MLKCAQIAMSAWALSALGTAALASPATIHHVRDVRFSERGGATRLVLDTEGQTEYKSGQLHNPERLYFDFDNTKPAAVPTRTIESSGVVKRIRVALTRRTTTRVVLDLAEPAEFETSQTANPSRFIIEVRRAGTPKQQQTEVVRPQPSPKKLALKRFVMPPLQALPKTPLIAPPRIEVGKVSREELLASLTLPPALWTMPRVLPPVKKKAIPVAKKSTAKAPGQELAKIDTQRALDDEKNSIERGVGEPAHGSSTLTRALGLKMRRVVLDAGHGGKDVGTISPHGMYEKDLVLDVTQRLGKMIEEHLASQVVYTRDDDTFVPLQERTAIANREKADLFLSIHANSSREPTVAGFETYYLNFSSLRADMDVASRENASSERTIADLSDIVKQIALNEKLDESRQFAGHVHEATYPLSVKTSGKIHDRGVKKAPFMVLIGARMPSVLVEIGFLTNPTEETQMKKAEYRQRIAEALFKGVSGYAETLSHFASGNGSQATALEARN